MGYDSFARFYDAAMRDYSWCEFFLKNPTGSVDGGPGALLELGCGTGRVLELLADSFDELYGLDLSRSMLAEARKRVPEAILLQEDMRTFNLNRRFDTILCLFDTINHLPEFDQWVELFSRVHNHLRPGGCFLLDINTAARMQRLAVLPPFLTKMDGDSFMLMEVNEAADQRFELVVQVFEALGEELFQRYRETIEEFAPPAADVLEALEAEFSLVRTFSEEGTEVVSQADFSTSRNGKLFFHCTP